ncbi:MAG: arsenate reductase (glutaredoxin) [Reyranellaceae bacterium]
MTLTIYHNPRCSKSRQTLALLEEKGVRPRVVEYLKTPPDPATLAKLAAALGGARAMLRQGEKEYAELGLADAKKTEQALLQAMHRHPILIERPIVTDGKRAVIGRPPEAVLALL